MAPVIYRLVGCVLTLLDKEILVWSERVRVPLINLYYSMPRRNMAGGKIKNEKKRQKHTWIWIQGGGKRSWVGWKPPMIVKRIACG